MPSNHFTRFRRILEACFGPVLTKPSFAILTVLAVGWILNVEQVHAVTTTLLTLGITGQRHHEGFHRFFSRGSWSPDKVGHWLFQYLEKRLGAEPLRVAIDDTLAPHSGAKVFGIGTHIDAVRSTRRHKIFSFGHCWVVLSVLVKVPFSSRVWALPILFRLYRNVKECDKNGANYNKKTELARQMLDILCTWTARDRIEVAIDSAYCVATVMHDLSPRVVVFGMMRPDAALTAPPKIRKDGPASGRPSKRGEKLPSPEIVANDKSKPWKKCDAVLYCKSRKLRYKTFCAQWYRVCGTRLLRVVIVATPKGTIPFRVWFSTDSTLDPSTIVETYTYRWGIEVLFRDLKQLFGLADSPVRREAAVLRMAPFVGLLYSMLVLWFAEGVVDNTGIVALAAPPVRPWYRHKKADLCFADILRAARLALKPADILQVTEMSERSKKSNARSDLPEESAVDRAA